eukprot:c40694_g1_i1.p1 GENE.c40694_g1_i1~~c40694_g1_i1.p1  ORF type:complete len:471 (-),score=107.07 c40694_g1_i1:10-1389(-)
MDRDLEPVEALPAQQAVLSVVEESQEQALIHDDQSDITHRDVPDSQDPFDHAHKYSLREFHELHHDADTTEPSNQTEATTSFAQAATTPLEAQDHPEDHQHDLGSDPKPEQAIDEHEHMSDDNNPQKFQKIDPSAAPSSETQQAAPEDSQETQPLSPDDVDVPEPHGICIHDFNCECPRCAARRGHLVLHQDRFGVSVVGAVPLHTPALNNTPPSYFVISSGSVVTFQGDCIVNAANQGCITGGGVDGAITSAGGPELRNARLALPEVNGIRCPTGEARITIGGRLNATWCIHAVGPSYNFGYLYNQFRGTSPQDEACDKKLHSAYANVIELARQNNIQTLGVSLLSSGIFRGQRSLDAVLLIGMHAIVQHAYPGLEVHMIAFQTSERRALEGLFEEWYHADDHLAAIENLMIKHDLGHLLSDGDNNSEAVEEEEGAAKGDVEVVVSDNETLTPPHSPQ